MSSKPFRAALAAGTAAVPAPADGAATDRSPVPAGTVLATLPLSAVFALLGRYMVSGITQGAVTG